MTMKLSDSTQHGAIRQRNKWRQLKCARVKVFVSVHVQVSA